MKIIVALGNPTKQYELTRHNAGVIVLENILSKVNKNWRGDNKFECLSCVLNIADLSKLTSELNLFNKLNKQFLLNDTKVICAFPQTYMNNSGSSVAKLLGFYKLELKDLLVIHDDLDIRLGSYLIQFAKGPKSHNGILSIENTIGKDFLRLRIGIENRDEKSNIEGIDYVLSKFNKDELNQLENILTNE